MIKGWTMSPSSTKHEETFGLGGRDAKGYAEAIETLDKVLRGWLHDIRT
jgi:hypothetical protein